MKINRYLILNIAFILFINSYAFSQGRKLYPGQTRSRMHSAIPISRTIAYPWTWSLGLGSTSYFGQLCATGDCFTSANYQFNLGLKYRFTTRISVGMGLRYLRMSASDASASSETGRPNRNISFRTDGYELTAVLQYDLIPIITRFMGDKSDQYNRRNFFVPYFIIGGGALYFDPQLKDPQGGNYVSAAKRITSEEKRTGTYYTQITPILIGGIGCRIKLSEFFDIGADFTYAKTFTDYLDDLGGGTHFPVNNKDAAFASSIDGRIADPNLLYLASNGDVTLRSNAFDAANPDPSLKSRGKTTSSDGYFIINLRLDYTMASPFSFTAQRNHRHFQSGKGARHHRFDRK